MERDLNIIIYFHIWTKACVLAQIPDYFKKCDGNNLRFVEIFKMAANRNRK